LVSVTPELGRVLKHELTHSFVGQKSHGRAPTWLQEGVAQYMEGRRTVNVGALLDAANQGFVPTLAGLEGSWMGLSGSSAAMAYAWSLAVVEAMVQAGGISDLSRLLDRIASAPSIEEAVRDALHSDYADLQQQTIVYLRRADVR
jgi:hypothetical protein